MRILIPSLYMAATAVAMPLQRRAIIRGTDNYIPLGNTTIPLTPLLLIFAALAVSLLSFILVLFRLLVPSCMSKHSRIVLREREQAKQDTRLRGGSSPRFSPDGSPLLHAPHRPLRKVELNSMTSTVPSELALDKRPAHGYRGTSFSLKDARKYSDKSHRSSSSALGLPLLRSSDSSSGSSSVHAGGMTERAPPSNVQRNDGRIPRPNFSHLHRNSSVGKGADLQRTRSGQRENHIPIRPQLVDRAYSHVSQRNFSHPLVATRRDSTFSVYEVSSSAEHSHGDGSTAESRIGSFSMATANPLTHYSNSHAQAWAAATPPLQPSRSYSPITAVAPDSDDSASNSECASPRFITSASAVSSNAHANLLVPTRLSSYTQQI